MGKLKVAERRAMAKRETSREKLAKFAQDRSPKVREEVVWNPNTPLLVLLRLANDKNERVRRYAKERLYRLESLLHKAAEDPSTPPELLYELGQYRWDSIRSAVAENPSTPLELLRELAKDMDYRVRKGVAFNPACPLELLEELAKDPIDDVRAVAVSNPNAPLEWTLEYALATIQKERRYGLVQLLPCVVEKLVKHLDELPQDPKLWTEMWTDAWGKPEPALKLTPSEGGLPF